MVYRGNLFYEEGNNDFKIFKAKGKRVKGYVLGAEHATRKPTSVGKMSELREADRQFFGSMIQEPPRLTCFASLSFPQADPSGGAPL